jgi:hypothetical protein
MAIEGQKGMQRTAVFAAEHYPTVIRYDSLNVSPDPEWKLL